MGTKACYEKLCSVSMILVLFCLVIARVISLNALLPLSVALSAAFGVDISRVKIDSTCVFVIAVSDLAHES